jgi:hypothetical protein
MPTPPVLEVVSLKWLPIPGNEHPRPLFTCTEDQWLRILRGLPEMDRLHSIYHAQRGQMSLLVPCLRIDDAF